ncbi:MAG: TonB-dependent receptor [Azoarcus sp.]|jgi:vitamin B12 transporter|nr:TonB-dependent receptor [Azoarcus sp.]
MFVRKRLSVALCLPAVILYSPLSFAQSDPNEAELAPVVVIATRQETRVDEVLADVTVIDKKEIERAGQDTLIDILSRQAGVQIMQSGGAGTTSSLYLRGANPNQTKILIDGIDISSMSDTPLRFLPLADIERVEIFRGPASMLYGADAIGGVIQIITKRGKPGFHPEAFIGYGSRNTEQLSAGLSGGNAQWRFRLEGNHYQTQGFSAARHTRNKDADKDAYRNDGGAASVSFLPVSGHEIGIQYRRNEGTAHYDSAPNGDSNVDYHDRFEIEQRRVFSRNRFLPAWESEVSYSVSENKHDNYNDWNGVPETTRTNTQNRQLSWQNNVDLPLGRALAAIEKFWQKTGPNTLDPWTGQPTYSGHAPKIDNFSALAGWTASMGKHRWQLNARHDRHSEFGHKNTYGASYGYQIITPLRAHISYGTAFRAPSIDDLYRPGWGGNPNLKPEESRNFETGLTWEKSQHQASIIYYHNRVKNLISAICDASWNCKNENVNKALLEGITLAYKGKFGDWRVEATYDWLNADNQSKDPADGVGYERLGRRARNKATLGLGYVWNNLAVSIEEVLVGRRYDLNYKKNAPDKEELGGYALTNLTARYAINKDFSIEGRLNNLFDKKYEHARGYNTDGFNAFLGLRYSPQ